MQDEIITLNPDKQIKGRTHEYCHGCGELRTEGEDMPWCSQECLDKIADEWWQEYVKNQNK